MLDCRLQPTRLPPSGALVGRRSARLATVFPVYAYNFYNAVTLLSSSTSEFTPPIELLSTTNLILTPGLLHSCSTRCRPPRYIYFSYKPIITPLELHQLGAHIPSQLRCITIVYRCGEAISSVVLCSSSPPPLQFTLHDMTVLTEKVLVSFA